MDGYIREFALQMLRKLQLRPAALRERKDADGDIKMNGHKVSNGPSTEAEPSGDGELVDENQESTKEVEHDEEDGQLPQEDLVQTPYLPDRIELPAQKQQVLQHVELLFALSVKVPEFLDE